MTQRNENLELTFVSGLKGSYSSKVELFKDQNDRQWVLKTVPEEEVGEIINEKYFLDLLRSHGLNAIDYRSFPDQKPNQILLEFLVNSITISDGGTRKVYELFGQQVAKLHSISFNQCLKLDSGSRTSVVGWQDFVLENLNYGLERIKTREINFSTKELGLIIERIKELQERQLNENMISLLHCDLHTNNALYVQDPTEKIYLFDKGSDILSGDPYYDLALVLIEFPSLFGLKPILETDESLFQSFIQGYKFDFWESNKRLCQNYALLRAIKRIGSPFTPYLDDLIKSIIYT